VLAAANALCMAARVRPALREGTSEDARRVLNGQGVAQLTQMLAQTRALVASLTRLSQDLEREPSKLIYGDRREGYTPQ